MSVSPKLWGKISSPIAIGGISAAKNFLTTLYRNLPKKFLGESKTVVTKYTGNTRLDRKYLLLE